MRLTTEGSDCKWGILSSVCIWMLLPGCCAAGLFGPLNSAQELLQSQDGALGADYLDIVAPSNPDTLELLVDALDVMQDGYFQLWEGKWPSANDWTSAVLGTYTAAALTTLSRARDYNVTSGMVVPVTALAHENVINKYFSQLLSFYFGQEHVRLRTEAYDDMLWVVLGWLEAIKFVNTHSALHHGPLESTSRDIWYGEQWIPAFAHRARIFWDLASKGWDTVRCGGGMLWSPYTSPYKNAITNELFIAGSISMYLHFPGDENSSPFFPSKSGGGVGSAKPKDPKYLQAAIEGYKWLKQSNMTDHQGLYVDGYHISRWNQRRNGSLVNTKCDERNEMVYTYNQGVLLSGQRGLYEATAAESYLKDGHQLISDVIQATGYQPKNTRPFNRAAKNDSKDRLPKWHGLGRRGILEDFCDAQGYCSQDGQTFKGIFFHHLSTFCTPIPPLSDGLVTLREYHETKSWHEKKCKQYAGWIKHNAEAAMSTKDHNGKFGTWWGANNTHRSTSEGPDKTLPASAIDYRNLGIPDDSTWLKDGSATKSQTRPEERDIGKQDLNDRGRGRTAETQGGGLSVLRALWEIAAGKDSRTS